MRMKHLLKRSAAERAGARRKVLFLVDDITRYGGVRTRVEEELGCLKHATDIEPIVFSKCYISNMSEVADAMTRLSEDAGLPRLKGIAYPRLPHGGVKFACEFSFAMNIFVTLAIIIPYALRHRVDLLYGHNNESGLSAIIASKILGCRSVVDLHGVEVDEYLRAHAGWNREGFRVRLWRRVERAIISLADRVVCVSNEHRDVVLQRGMPLDDPVVIPCFSDETRFSFDDSSRADVRARLGIRDDEILFVYSGLVHERMGDFNPIRFYSRLRYVKSKRLLVLTGIPSLPIARRDITPELENEITIMSVNRPEVARYLSASDVAILLREESVVNRVASPTKFSEYLLCGLPVIISPQVGDASGLVERHGIGVNLPRDGSEWTEGLTEELLTVLLSLETKNRAREVGLAALSVEANGPVFIELLRRQLTHLN